MTRFVDGKLLRLVFFVMIVILEVPGSFAVAEDQVWGRWNLRQSSIAAKSVRPTVGKRPAKVHGPVVFDSANIEALRFSGNDKQRNHLAVDGAISDLQLPARTLAVEAWVKVDQAREWGGLVGLIQDNGDYERGWLLGFRKSSFFFGLSSKAKSRLTYLTSPNLFEIGHWYHVLGTYDGKTQSLYVDGKFVAQSTAQSGDIHYPEKGTFSIGAYRDDNEFYGLKGSIEQVSVWNRSFDPREVAARFDARKSLFPGIIPVHPKVADWPTYARDNQRTGISEDELRFPLKLKWVHQSSHVPKPAWPEPARQDFWHKKKRLKARVTYDRAFHVVTAGDRVFYGSSADDQLYCLDTDLGNVQWTVFAEGPIRLAPTIAGDRVLFGSDDGYVYCVNAIDGRLNWKFRLGPSERRIPGNSRIISVWPVRSGVLVDGNVAYFCAGIFPSQGVYQAAIDIRSGKKLASGPISVSAQGYLSRKAGRLFAVTGRDPAGSFVAQLTRRGKGVASEVRRIPEEFPFAFVGCANARFGGGDQKVVAFRVTDGLKLWSAEIDGRAYSMALARGSLYVSTDKGKIYCFAASISNEPIVEEREVLKSKQTTITSASEILETADVQQGYALVIGSGDGRLAYELARQSQLQIVGLESKEKLVADSRETLANLYGRVSIHQHTDKSELPYTDYLFNLIVDNRDGSDSTLTNLQASEIERVLRPQGGVLISAADRRIVRRRGPLEGIGEWTHMYADAANTVCSSDQRVGGQMALQWFGPPGPRQMLDRHHRTVPPLYKDGRVFIPGNDRVTAADAYNGTVLWSVAIPNSRRIGVFRDSSYMVASQDVLYVAAENKCWVLDAKTGHRRKTISVPQISEKSSRHWGYLATVDDLVIGTSAHPKAARRKHNLKAIDDTYYDSRPLVGSDSVFVVDHQSGGPIWTYPAETGLIVNPTITVGGGLIYFVESANEQTLNSPNGRATPGDLLAKGSYLVALDMRSGSIVWKEPHDFSAIQHNIYLTFAKDKLIVVGSRNDGTDRKKSRVWYDVHAFNSRNGERLWKTTQKQPTKIGGSHGEQDHHPVIVGNRLYCEPFAYDLNSGKPLANWKWQSSHRRGCGTISASATTFFFRQSNPTMFDLNTNKYSKLTTTTRPGCWINMIPAGGLLLIPEASSGCTCNFAVQTSLAFLPIAPKSSQ